MAVRSKRSKTKAEPGKVTNRKVRGRMPQRSEAVSGVDAAGLAPVTETQAQEMIAKTKTSPKRANA
jgi:hypothetical protein